MTGRFKYFCVTAVHHLRNWGGRGRQAPRLLCLVSRAVVGLTFVWHFPEGFGAGGIPPRPRHEASPEAQRLARLCVRVSRETSGAGDLFLSQRWEICAQPPAAGRTRCHSEHTIKYKALANEIILFNDTGSSSVLSASNEKLFMNNKLEMM